MKISKKQLRQIIRETRMMHPNPSPMRSRAHPAIRDIVKRQKLLEYEQYVDEEGNIHDDEGNVTRRGSEFGRMYGGGTYGLHAPWERSSSRRSYRPAPDRSQVDAVKAVLDVKEDKFLRSILGQLEAGRKLSAKQKKIVRRIIKKTSEGAGMNPDSALALFEGRKMRVTKRQLRRIIRESILLERRGGRPATEGLTALRDVLVFDRVESLGQERGGGKDRFHVSLPYEVIWPEVRMARHPVLAPPEGEAYATKKMLKKIGGDLFAYGPEAVGPTEKKALINLERKIDMALARIDEKSADPKWAENPAAVEALNALSAVLGGL